MCTPSAHTRSNLQVLCSKCNRSKGHQGDTDFRIVVSKDRVEGCWLCDTSISIALDRGERFRARATENTDFEKNVYRRILARRFLAKYTSLEFFNSHGCYRQVTEQFLLIC